MSKIPITAFNPIEIAKPFAASIGMRKCLGATAEEENLLVSLESISEASGFDGTYFVETSRALSIPVSFDADEPVGLLDFYRVAFEGLFATYSIVSVGKIIGAFSVRALCATFREPLLLPDFNTIPNNHLLHVPVLAVGSIERTS